MVPSEAPLQLTLVALITGAESTAGCVIVTVFELVVQLLASCAVTV